MGAYSVTRKTIIWKVKFSPLRIIFNINIIDYVTELDLDFFKVDEIGKIIKICIPKLLSIK